MRIEYLPYSIYKSTMPNLCPVDYRNSVAPRIQSSSCGPTSIANIIRYLAGHNLRQLMPPQGKSDETIANLRLIETLTRIMHTTQTGTVASDLISGLEKYVRDRGYKISIEWAGKSYSGKYKYESLVDPEWIMNGTIGPYNSILWLGNYEYNTKRETYKRKTGHAVTVAGFSSVYDELLIHDPSPIKRKYPIYCKLHKLTKGTLKNGDGIDHLAKRFYELREVYPYKDDGSLVTIIEGALSFEVFRK